MSARVTLLETTLRDGSYEINHQITAEDTALIAGALEAAGIRYIEVGHGMGVGADRHMPGAPKFPLGAATDEECIRAARAAAPNVQLGVLILVGELFCPPSYLHDLKRWGIDFIRFGLFPSDWGPFLYRSIDEAKSIGLTVSINLMQTYAWSANRVAEAAADASKRGADWFYIVDSAGGMQPNEVETYVRAILGQSKMQVGLHAHNNSGLAVANSLAAINAGATFVDSTLNGVGRATGNPPTELLLLALQARGHEKQVDLDAILRFGSLARNWYNERGNDPLNFASGAGLVHSRNAKDVLRISGERGRAPGEFLIQVGREARKQECLDAHEYSEQLYQTAAERTPQNRVVEPTVGMVEAHADALAAQASGELSKQIRGASVRAGRSGQPLVLHFVDAREHPLIGPQLWSGAGVVGLSIAFDPTAPMPALGVTPDVVIAEPSFKNLPKAKKLKLLVPMSSLIGDAIAELSAVADGAPRSIYLAPSLDPALSSKLAERLSSAGIELAKDTAASAGRIIVAGSEDNPAWLDGLDGKDLVVLPLAGRDAVVLEIRKRGARALRPSIGTVLAARAASALALHERMAKPLEPTQVESQAIVDPWLAAAPGETMVDDPSCPTWIVSAAGAERTLFQALARARSRALMAGRGRL